MEKKLEIKSFFEGWNLYQQVIKYNYMVHNEIIDWLLPRFKSINREEIDVLELGCGDAYTITKITGRIPVNHYTGVDLSEHALEFAADNLGNNIGSFQLLNGDMSEIIRKIDRKFDVVMANYSIHHLLAPIKQKLCAEINSRLSPGGMFFMIDIIKYEEEQRLDYLNRGNGWYSNAWNKLSKDQLDSVYEHTLSSDFPESFEFFKEAASKAGLQCTASTYLDKHNLFGAMEFIKNKS